MQRSVIVAGVLTAVATLLVGLVVGRALSDEPESEPVESGAQPSVVADEAASYLLAPEFVGNGEPDAAADIARVEAGDVSVEPDRFVALLAPISVDDPDVIDVAQLTTSGGAGSSSSFAAAGVVGITEVPGAVDLTMQEAVIVDRTDDTAGTDEAADSDDSSIGPVADSPVGDEPIDVPEIGTDAPEPDDAAPGGPAVPTVVLPDLGVWLEIPPITFDPCAGPVPGGVVCAGGVASTIFALSAPPPLEISVTPGIATTPRLAGGVACPAGTPTAGDGQLAFTIWSSTPLASADVDVRPAGSALAPVELTVATAAEVRDEWQSRFDAADEYDLAWGLVPTCVVADVDFAGTGEVAGIAIDTFDRLGAIPATPLPVDTGGRPPTETRIEGVSPVAHVRAWTTEEGSVVFRPRSLGNDAVDEGDLDCATAGRVPDARVFPSNRPNPDIYDPDFSRSFFTGIPLNAGGRLLVCVEIYDTANPLIPLVVERHLFEAPMQPRPEVYLASIDTTGDGDAIDALSWGTGSAAFGAASLGCDKLIGTPEIDADTLAQVNEVLWECPGPLTSLTPTGTFELPLQVRRDGSTIVDVALPIDANDCATERCPQRTDYFRLPIVAPGELVCWRGIDQVCPGEPEVDAVALIAVKYPLRVGRGGIGGRVIPLDEVDVSVLADEPQLTRPTMTVQSTTEFARWDATFRFQTDRPVRAAIEPFELPSGRPCGEPERSELTADADTEFALDVAGLCGGRAYGVYVHLVDDDGTEWQVDPGSGYVTPATPTANFGVHLDFVSDGSGSSELWIEPGDRAELVAARGSVRLPTSAGRSRPQDAVNRIPGACFDATETLVEDQSVRLRSDTDELFVQVRLPVRPVAAGDDCTDVKLEWDHHVRCSELDRSSDEYFTTCVDPPGSAPAPPRIRAVNWSFTAGVPVEDLQTGSPVVVTSAFNDAGVAMRFTLERSSAWAD